MISGSASGMMWTLPIVPMMVRLGPTSRPERGVPSSPEVYCWPRCCFSFRSGSGSDPPHSCFGGLSLVLPFYPFYRKVIEERELEIRFGTSRREYPSNTPVLIRPMSERPGGKRAGA